MNGRPQDPGHDGRDPSDSPSPDGPVPGALAGRGRRLAWEFVLTVAVVALVTLLLVLWQG